MSHKVDLHYCSIWGEENLNQWYEHDRDLPEVNIWHTMPSSDIYGPYFFDDCTVTSILYLSVLRQVFIPLLQVFQQDVAQHHFVQTVKKSL